MRLKTKKKLRAARENKFLTQIKTILPLQVKWSVP